MPKNKIVLDILRKKLKTQKLQMFITSLKKKLNSSTISPRLFVNLINIMNKNFKSLRIILFRKKPKNKIDIVKKWCSVNNCSYVIF